MESLTGNSLGNTWFFQMKQNLTFFIENLVKCHPNASEQQGSTWFNSKENKNNQLSIQSFHFGPGHIRRLVIRLAAILCFIWFQYTTVK